MVLLGRKEAVNMFNFQQPNNPYSFGAPAMPYLPNYSPQQPVQQAQPNNVSWIYVNGMEGARGQIVQPNQTAWMMDNSDPVIYVKSVDAVGTATLKAFRLTEINATAGSQSPPVPDMSAYATRVEMDDITNRLKSIEEVIGGLNA